MVTPPTRFYISAGVMVMFVRVFWMAWRFSSQVVEFVCISELVRLAAEPANEGLQN